MREHSERESGMRRRERDQSRALRGLQPLQEEMLVTGNWVNATCMVPGGCVLGRNGELTMG